jgi:hypothetical protein
VISPGEQIMLIVPDADALAVEVKIPPKDIDQVYVGQTATMRFAAFNQKTTPEIDGEIGVVAADITQDKRTGASYYTARVLMKPEELAKLGSAKLVPGMPVDVFIQTPGLSRQAPARPGGARIQGALMSLGCVSTRGGVSASTGLATSPLQMRLTPEGVS